MYHDGGIAYRFFFPYALINVFQRINFFTVCEQKLQDSEFRSGKGDHFPVPAYGLAVCIQDQILIPDLPGRFCGRLQFSGGQSAVR